MPENTSSPPCWIETPPPPGSYRSLFKWGEPAVFKHPNRGMYALIKDAFGMTDADFITPQFTGMQPFDFPAPPPLEPAHRVALEGIVGAENVRTDPYDLARLSYGGGMFDALRMRQRRVENLPAAVVAPRTSAEVQAVLEFCQIYRIPLYPRGGGTSVTRGTEAVCGGISLDMSAHMHLVLGFSEIDQTITVQAGMAGPELEALLNDAPDRLGAQRRYTCGHFPQSFMHTTVGGWVVTRGAGQNSTYYGKIEDMVLSQEYVTPRGLLRTPAYPRCATGPDYNQVMLGSEGCFGVLTAVTLRVFRYTPENTRRFSCLFRTWEEGLSAVREVMQGQFGLPSVFRLSDPEETDVALRMYHIHASPADTVLKALGYQPAQRCLLLGTADGDASYTRLVARKVAAAARQHGAFPLTAFGVTQRWEKSRFTDPYLREDLMDFGLLIDTLECAVTWEQLPKVHVQVRQVIKSRPHTICMTHLSHMYPQGANLYFIFIARMSDMDEYLRLQYAILEAIRQSGASMSHHHGIGKQTAPWLEDQIGSACMDVLRTLKNHFDPANLLNPGGTLGLDMDIIQRQKRWGLRTRKE